MIEQKRKILIILPSYSVKWGGPARVVHDICIGLAHHFQFSILTTVHNADDEILPIPKGIELISFNTHKPLANLWKSYSGEIDDWLDANLTKFSIVHIHEMWHYLQFAAANKAMKLGIPYLVSPHGELDNWRISQKSIRKRIFGAVFQKKMLHNASQILALTKFEQKSIENFAGPTNNITIIPNTITELVNLNGVGEIHANKKYILFLGRIQKVKGCLELLLGYSQWQANSIYDLVFAGPKEEERYYAELTKQVNQLKLQGKVHFVGLVSGAKKSAWLKNASLFVLPSFSEGFPVAVLEAFQAECPVLISVNTGINDLVEENSAGLICEPTPDSIKKGLEAFEKLSENEVEAMVENAGNLIKSNFSVDRVMERYALMYTNF
jgi:glycosyltransferase involved in cell wall biosynthesis